MWEEEEEGERGVCDALFAEKTPASSFSQHLVLRWCTAWRRPVLQLSGHEGSVRAALVCLGVCSNYFEH